MKRNLLTALALVAVLASCGPKDQTRLLINFGEGAAEGQVEIAVGDDLDTLVQYTNGKLDILVPAAPTQLAYAVADDQPLQFVSDGSTITLDFIEKKAVSSNKRGPQAQMTKFLAWQDEFMDDFYAKREGLSEEEETELLEKTLAEYNKHLKEVIKANPDNVVGLMAISSLELDDNDEMLEILKSLSDELKARPNVSSAITALETAAVTGEGKMFADFTVVQDPEDPEGSTVKLSDYVGKGKYMLVDFWASWCGPCRDELPFLKAVYEKYKGDDFDIIGVAVSDTPTDTRKAVVELEIPWSQIINAQLIPGEVYGIQYIPHIILFGPDGTILKRDLRHEGIEEAVAEALGR